MAVAQIRISGSHHVDSAYVGAVVLGQLAAQFLGFDLVEHNKAAVTRCHSGAKVSKEEFIPAIGPSVERTDVIAGRKPNSRKTKLNCLRHSRRLLLPRRSTTG
jgi:hypothetical protein